VFTFNISLQRMGTSFYTNRKGRENINPRLRKSNGQKDNDDYQRYNRYRSEWFDP
jgi:hypothetical protein